MKYLTLITLLLLTTGLFSQNSDVHEDPGYLNCGKFDATEAFLEAYPEQRAVAEAANAELEAITREYEDSPLRDDDLLIIPVVFHIIHNNGIENISDAQIQSAIDVMNADYTAQNPGVNNVVAQFQSRVANVNFEFRLAKKDPDGNCTNGIVRTFDPATNAGGENLKMISPSWGRDKYLNIWVCKTIESGAAGYAILPGYVNGPVGAAIDGIVIAHSYVGSTGTSSNYASHALTHEVGHWANLEHTWGPTNSPGTSSNCSVDDGIIDTPNTIGWTTCDLAGESCGSLDNVQNFMEYSYCSRMFTNGQKNRMRAAMGSNIAQRNQLSTPANLAATGVLEDDIVCMADFIIVGEEVVCSDQQIQFQDVSYNGVTQWEWSFPGGTPATSTSASPTVVYSSPGSYSVTLVASNANSSATITKTDHVHILPSAENALPYMEGFEALTDFESNTENWRVVNPDGANSIEWKINNQVAYAGGKSAYVKGYSNTPGTVEELQSPTYDLTGLNNNAVLRFKYAHARRSSSTQDKLQVYISRNCGLNWNQRLSREGDELTTVSGNYSSEFVPASAADWTTVEITNISSIFLTEDFRIKFVFTSHFGNNIYIDNINIFDPATVGLEDHTFLNYIKVFPNPAADNLTLNYSLKTTGELKVDLLDISGRLVESVFEGDRPAGEHTQNIQVNNLSPGIYFVRLSVNGGQITRKLVVQH